MLRLGIVGLPNVGKSTLFNALTSSKAAAAENYPFCTVEPNVGVVEVPDARLDRLFAVVRPKKKVPAVVEFVDIAGLVKGASQGEGLGNQFLSHIREVDAVVHVIRCFDDPDVVHVMGPVDPVRAHDVITSELALADLAVVERRLDKTGKTARAGETEAQAELVVLERVMAAPATAYSASRRFSRWAKTKCAPGPCIGAIPRSRRPERSTPTSSAGSSGPRPCRSRTSCGRGPTRRPGSRAWCAARDATTWSRTETSCCSGSTSSTGSTSESRRNRRQTASGTRWAPRI